MHQDALSLSCPSCRTVRPTPSDRNHPGLDLVQPQINPHPRPIPVPLAHSVQGHSPPLKSRQNLQTAGLCGWHSVCEGLHKSTSGVLADLSKSTLGQHLPGRRCTHLRTPDTTQQTQPPERSFTTTHPQNSILAHGRKSASHRSAQFLFAFMPLAEGRDPSRPVPAPGRLTHPHDTIPTSVTPSTPSPVLYQPQTKTLPVLPPVPEPHRLHQIQPRSTLCRS